MANTSLFNKFQNKLTQHNVEQHTRDSMNWFMKNLRNVRVDPSKILQDATLLRTNRPLIGRMYQFVYDAKLKEELPYYDRFPLSLIVGPAPNGFYGLNLHYLQPALRFKLFDKLLEHTNNDKYDETTKIKISYNILNSVRTLKEFQPCFKHYLTSQLESRLMLIPSENWEIAIFLPTERFKNADNKTVWRNSKRSIK